MATTHEVIPGTMWKAALLVATQSFLYGYVFSCFNSCLLTGDNNVGSDCFHGTDSSCPKGTVYNDLNLTTFEASLATSLTVVGGWIGCLFAAKPAEFYGRKPTLMFNNIFFIVGAALSASGNLEALFIGRFLSGLGVGVASIVVPVLLSEIASHETKGTITTLCQVNVTFAIFFSAILGYGFVVYVEHGWQYMQVFSAIPSVVMLIMYSSVPESPKWLLSKLTPAESKLVNTGATDSAKYQEVKTILTGIRLPETDIDREIAGIMEDAKADADNVNSATWAEVFSNRNAMIIGCGLLFFQAMTGINSVTFYSTTIFGLAGFSPSIAGTACWSFINFVTTIVSAYYIDKWGRKIFLTTGTYMMLFSLIALSATLLSNALDDKVQGGLAVLFVLLFVIGFAMGLGAVVWVIMSEIMPTRLRVKAMSLFLSINWVCNIIISFLTLTAIDELGGGSDSNDQTDDEIAEAQKKGVAYLYFIFAAFTLVAAVFMYFCVPETKGKHPDDLMSNSSVHTSLLTDAEKQQVNQRADMERLDQGTGGGNSSSSSGGAQGLNIDQTTQSPFTNAM